MHPARPTCPHSIPMARWALITQPEGRLERCQAGGTDPDRPPGRGGPGHASRCHSHLGLRAQGLQAQLRGPPGLGVSGLSVLPMVADPLGSKHTLHSHPHQAGAPAAPAGTWLPCDHGSTEKAGLELRTPALPSRLSLHLAPKEPGGLSQSRASSTRLPGAPRGWWQKPEGGGLHPRPPHPLVPALGQAWQS